MIAVGWEGRAVLCELLRKVDRSGVLDHGGDTELIPDMLRIPVDLFLTGFAKLLKRGVVQATDRAIVLPNFMEAQDTPQSDAARKRAERARRRTETLQGVTGSHAESRDVTKSHSEPLPSVPVPDQTEHTGKSAEPTEGEVKKTGKRLRIDPTPEEAATVERVLSKLSERAHVNYRPDSVGHQVLIIGLLRKGYTERDLRMVIWHRWEKWGAREDMAEFLRPKTLFGPDNFAEYLPQAEAAWAKANGNGARDGPYANEPVSEIAQQFIRGGR